MGDLSRGPETHWIDACGESLISMNRLWSGLLAETTQQCIKAIPVHVQAVLALANWHKTVQMLAESKSMPAGRKGLDCRRG